MSSLAVDDIVVRFADVTVLDHAHLHLDSGERVALLGPSGSGKSTLLKVIAGLIRPERGRVLVDGRDVTDLPTHRRGIGMVFQDNQLFPHRDVAANVGFGLRIAGVDVRERDERVSTWLDRVGLSGFEGRSVTDLSGGEATRVALARTMVVRPRIVLLDEPLTGLDRELHDQLRVELGLLLRTEAVTALTVTHDHDDARALSDRVVDLADLGD